MKDVTVHVTEEAGKALERIALFNKGASKKDIVSDLILKEVAKFKGKKPPKK